MSQARTEDTIARVRLHLLRHAHAGDPTEWEGDDDLRPLTRKGRRQCERLGAFLDAHGVRPDVIVSSPKVRAMQTAELVAGTLGMTVRADPRLGQGLGRRELWDILGELGAREPMLVGHDPDLSELLGHLLDAAGLHLRKGALATVDVDVDPAGVSGTLCWLIPPDLLAVD
jgi:phosphohistidine phosphatase